MNTQIKWKLIYICSGHIVMLGEHGAGPEVWLERGYQRARSQNEGTEGPDGTATSRRVPQTLLDPSFIAKMVCVRGLGGQNQKFSQGRPCTSIPSPLPIKPCSYVILSHIHCPVLLPLPTKLLHTEQTCSWIGMFCLPMCHDSDSSTDDAIDIDKGHFSLFLLSLTVLCFPLSSIYSLYCSDREHLEKFFWKVLDVLNPFTSRNIFN